MVRPCYYRRVEPKHRNCQGVGIAIKKIFQGDNVCHELETKNHLPVELNSIREVP